MSDTAIPRVPGTMPHVGQPGDATSRFLDWANQQLQTDPSFRPPNGTKIENGRIVIDSGLMGDLLKQLLMAGVGVAGLGTASALMGPAAAGGGAASAVPAIPTTAGWAGSGAAGTGTAGAAGAVAHGASAFGVKDALQLAPLAASFFSKPAGTGHPPQEDAMSNLINLQTNRLQQSDPLYQAILKMAMGLLPKNVQGGMPGLPTAPPSSTPALPRRR